MTNDEQSEDDGGVAPVTPEERATIRDAISSKYGTRLRPGESLSANVERTPEHCWARVIVEAADETFRLELEAAAVRSDEDDPKQWKPEERFQQVLDLIDLQLNTFFEEDRTPRFHDDWRVYNLTEGGVDLRFRGKQRRPDLEALADQWLDTGGDPKDETN